MISVIDEQHLQVGDRVWWGESNSHSTHRDGVDWEYRQFLVHFENKWWVSVIWGYCTYSDNHDLPWYEPDQQFNETPELVEAAIFHRDRQGMQGNGDPYAYIDAEQLNALLEMVSVLPTDAHITWTGE